eukprot:Rmarinus@m.7071
MTTRGRFMMPVAVILSKIVASLPLHARSDNQGRLTSTHNAETTLSVSAAVVVACLLTLDSGALKVSVSVSTTHSKCLRSFLGPPIRFPSCSAAGEVVVPAMVAGDRVRGSAVA